MCILLNSIYWEFTRIIGKIVKEDQDSLLVGGQAPPKVGEAHQQRRE